MSGDLLCVVCAQLPAGARSPASADYTVMYGMNVCEPHIGLMRYHEGDLDAAITAAAKYYQMHGSKGFL